jgi:peptide/nickel transport system permease protein
LLDDLLSRAVEMFLMIPSLFLVILAVALFGTNMYISMICVGLTVWPSNAKIMRAQVLSIKSREFVTSAKLIGASNFRILVKHIIPNAIAPVVANATLLVGSAILTEAALSFLGLGDLNHPSWGQMLHYAQYYFRAWWMALFPGLFITVTIVAFNFLGSGLNVALNPKLRLILGKREEYSFDLR